MAAHLLRKADSLSLSPKSPGTAGGSSTHICNPSAPSGKMEDRKMEDTGSLQAG